MRADNAAPRPASRGREERRSGIPRLDGRGGDSVARGAAAIIDRLECVRQTGPGRWIARCPAHADRAPSLSIRELEDGRVLIHCHAGCGALDVLSAIGLDWQALFPRRLDIETHSLAPSHSRIPARDLLAIVDHEIAVACLILTDVLEQRAVSEAQWQRLAQAAARIGRARDQVSPAEVRHA